MDRLSVLTKIELRLFACAQFIEMDDNLRENFVFDRNAKDLYLRRSNGAARERNRTRITKNESDASEISKCLRDVNCAFCSINFVIYAAT